MDKRMLTLLFMAALIGLWRIPYEIPDSREVTFQLSNDPEESTAIVLQDGNLLIRNLPKTEMFNYVMLQLVGVQDALPMKKCKNIRKEVYDVKFSLKDVPDGSYFIEIYTAPKKYTTYTSYIHGQSLCIQISDASVEFVEPLALTKNEGLFAQDSVTPDFYLNPTPMIQSDHPTIVECARAVTDGLATDYDKLKAIHDWVCNNVWYDYDALNNIPGDESAMETLDSRKSLCIGYASLTAALLRSLGIPTKLVTGYVLNTSERECWTEDLIAANKSNHVWNEAYVDNRWVIIDTTYDSNNTYKNNTFSTGTGMKNRKYFDITLEFLSTDRYMVPSEYDPLGYR